MEIYELNTINICPYFSVSYFFLTGNFGVSLKQLYTQYIGWYICFEFDFNFHAEGHPLWIPFSHFIVSFIVTSQLFPSWHVQFITCYWMHSAMMSIVRKKWIHIFTWSVNCQQKWTHTEQNVTCLMLTHISSRIHIRAVFLKSVAVTQKR